MSRLEDPGRDEREHVGFFFSSGRRHTRFDCDWSSDVCSSDLVSVLDSSGSFASIENGYALPLDARYMRELGRTDDGVDIETPPDGALVYSMTPGVVSKIGRASCRERV